MSSTPSSSKPATKDSEAANKPAEKTEAHLGVLEEDDEFDEFPVAGEYLFDI